MKKKILIISAALVIVALAVSLTVFFLTREQPREQEIFFSDGFEYILLDDGTAEIISYTGSDKKIVVPSTVFGLAVTSIGDRAFDSSRIETCELGIFVTRIGDRAFRSCTELTKLTFGTELLHIGDYAFNSCTALTSLTLPDSVTYIGEGAFTGCVRLADLGMSSSLQTLGSSAFEGCISLTAAILPDSCTAIGKNTFYGCTALKSVTVSENLTTLGALAFSGCKSLESISLGSEVREIGENSFFGCNSLADLTVASDNPRYTSDGGVLVDKAECRVIIMPSKSTVTEYTVPSYVTEIAEYAFRNCVSLERVTLPDGLRVIGTYAFYFCDNLSKINIPDGVTRIGGLAFEGTAFYKGLTDEFTVVGDSILLKYTPVRDTSLPHTPVIATENAEPVYLTVTSGDKTEQRLLGLRLTLPDGIKSMSSAFAGCDEIYEAVLPDSLTFIDDYAFWHATMMTAIDFADSSVSYIGDSAFENCRALKLVTLPDTLTAVGDNLFLDCYALTEASIPASLVKIGNFSLSANCQLRKLDIPVCEELGEKSGEYLPVLSELNAENWAVYRYLSLKNCRVQLLMGKKIEKIKKKKNQRPDAEKKQKVPSNLVQKKQNDR